jgi:CHAT domain-containing protein
MIASSVAPRPGFFVCGAETVVASLWKVDDTATALLMSRFYANDLGRSASGREVDGVSYRAGEPLPKLAALREARSWLRSLTVADRDRLAGAAPERIAEAATRGVIAERSAAPVDARPEARSYDHPYYWSAFVLYGSAQ